MVGRFILFAFFISSITTGLLMSCWYIWGWFVKRKLKKVQEYHERKNKEIDNGNNNVRKRNIRKT